MTDDAHEIEQLAHQLDPICHEKLGKPAWDCTWTELEELLRQIDADYCHAIAEGDQYRAALRDLDGNPR